MTELAVGITDKNITKPEPRGERVAAYVDEYLRLHPGLSLGELAFRLRADKRDMHRLLRDRSCGSRLEDDLAGYFGDDFIETVIRRPLLGDGPSRRERELERERAEIAARNERLRRDREARGRRWASPGPVPRLVSDQGGQAHV